MFTARQPSSFSPFLPPNLALNPDTQSTYNQRTASACLALRSPFTRTHQAGLKNSGGLAVSHKATVQQLAEIRCIDLGS